MRLFAALALSLLAFGAVPAAAEERAFADQAPGQLEASDAVAVPSLADQLLAVLETQDGLSTLAIAEENPPVALALAGSERFVYAARPAAPAPRGEKRFGPFRVIDATHVALVGVIDSDAPRQFAALLRAYPGIAEIEMIECPGTEDDRANLALGRMIHTRAIATHVPANGSVRSGGVELFLAGTRRIADPGAQFAVHSWEDEDGREAKDYPPDAPENRAYLDYYREMGMSPEQASAFYAMTNSVSFDHALYFGREEMARWVALN